MLTTTPQKQDQTSSQSKKSEGFFFQPKLTINQPNDVYEQEADAVADNVMRMPETSPSLAGNKPFFSPPTITINKPNTAKEEPQKKENKEEETEEALPGIQAKLSLDALPSSPDDKKANDTLPIQRKCAHCEEEEKKVQRKEMNSEITSFFKPLIQPKLSVSQPNDIYEQEADAMANKVMNTTNDESTQQPFFKPDISIIQRKCTNCEEEEKETIQRKSVSESTIPLIQTKNSDNSVVSDSLSSSIQSSRGNGSAMDKSTQSFMENRFGTDFNSVKIHTGNDAAHMNKGLNAKAFTVGNDVYFNEGKYEPETSDGKKLLAHELTHVVQQCGTDLIQRDPQPTQVVAATATDHREFVNDSIHFLEISASGLGDMNIDQAAVDRILDGWNINAATVERNITQQLNNDQALRTRFRQAYNNALKVLVNRASVRLNKPATRIYMENWHRVPEWASFNLSDIPATTEAERRAIIQSTIDAFNDIALFNGFTTLDRPTLESLLRRLKDFAIENREMIRNQIANDIAFARQLKEAYRQAVRTLLNRAAPTIGSTVFDLYMEFRYGASGLILDWADETVPRISTPIPQGLTPTRSGSVVFTYHGINVTILPDGTKTSPGAITNANFNFNNAMSATPNRSGVIIRHRGPGQPQLTIRTQYGPRLTPTTRSGYGRGTTATDIAEGDTSLGFHEGHHGRDFLEFIENHPWQQFTGTDGMSISQFRQAMTDYNTAASTYSADLERFSELQTDCVGVTIEDHYRGLRRRSPVNC